MRGFFADEAAQARLKDAARLWIGTPWHDNAGLLRVGVDCIHLAQAVYQKAGLPLDDQLPIWSATESAHNLDSRMLAWLEASDYFQPVQEDARPGDLLLFRLFRFPFHCGIFIGGREFLHVIQNAKVHLANLDDGTWHGRLHPIHWRPVA